MNDIPTAVNPRFLLIVRCAIALIWLYEGLWQKLIARDAYELSIVRQFTNSDDTALQMMSAIGTAETLLAVAILSGFFARPLAWFQISILVVMNLTGIFFGNNTIEQPIGLLIKNMPLLLCMGLIGLYGPGCWKIRARSNHE